MQFSLAKSVAVIVVATSSLILPSIVPNNGESKAFAADENCYRVCTSGQWFAFTNQINQQIRGCTRPIKERAAARDPRCDGFMGGISQKCRQICNDPKHGGWKMQRF
jgi:hypothetical protein